ncbi:hypothetical protein NMD14_13520 [Aeromonas veronii]
MQSSRSKLHRVWLKKTGDNHLTPAHTEPFYRQNYWAPARCDLIASLSPALSIVVFDAGTGFTVITLHRRSISAVVTSKGRRRDLYRFLSQERAKALPCI